MTGQPFCAYPVVIHQTRGAGEMNRYLQEQTLLYLSKNSQPIGGKVPESETPAPIPQHEPPRRQSILAVVRSLLPRNRRHVAG
jgi:hypothetical protein